VDKSCRNRRSGRRGRATPDLGYTPNRRGPRPFRSGRPPPAFDDTRRKWPGPLSGGRADPRQRAGPALGRKGRSPRTRRPSPRLARRIAHQTRGDLVPVGLVADQQINKQSKPRLGESLGLGEGEGEGLGDGDGLGEGDGDGDWDGLGEGFGVGLGLGVLGLGDEPVGEDVDGVPVAGGEGDGSAAISRPKIGGRITLVAGDELGLADGEIGSCITRTGDGEGAWMAADGANEGGGSAKSPPSAAWE
jgi:hypothetical protein